MRETTIAIPVPSGSLGIKLIGTNIGTVISEVNEDSALAENVCPGDKIISIDDIDVHQMDTACESALSTFSRGM